MTIDPSAQSAGVLITMGRVYEEVTAARKDIGSLDSKVEQSLKQGADHETRIRMWEREGATKEDLEALAVQVQDLQRGRWKIGGAAVAVSVLTSSGIVGVIATKMLGH